MEIASKKQWCQYPVVDCWYDVQWAQCTDQRNACLGWLLLIRFKILGASRFRNWKGVRYKRLSKLYPSLFFNAQTKECVGRIGKELGNYMFSNNFVFIFWVLVWWRNVTWSKEKFSLRQITWNWVLRNGIYSGLKIVVRAVRENYFPGISSVVLLVKIKSGRSHALRERTFRRNRFELVPISCSLTHLFWIILFVTRLSTLFRLSKLLYTWETRLPSFWYQLLVYTSVQYSRGWSRTFLE